MATTLYRLIKIFRETLDEEDLVFDADFQGPIEGWDSLAHVQLMLAIESEFDLTLSLDDAASMTSIPEILKVLESKGVGD